MRSSYSLGDHSETFARELVRSGRYASVSEVLRDGMRLMEEREALREWKLAELQKAIKEGLEGPFEDYTDSEDIKRKAVEFWLRGYVIMPLRIRRGTRARSDQSAIWLYIATNNLAAADQQIDRFHEAIGTLAEYPEGGRQRLEFDASLRAFPIDQYVLFYRISPGILDIVSTLHAARDVTPDILTD